ncbi:MAG: 2'-5' RNA ligase family protein [Gemmatimonadota bacterium]|nr:2'-5' RNA ligase family protein [Gemmatimonadota bacterium]
MSATFGIFVLAELPGDAGAMVRDIQQRFDPKLARLTPPHVTLVGSSGVGSMPTDTPVARIRAALEPIAATTAPMSLALGLPHRFMQTDIVSLPLDHNGPLRALHERIACSGLPFKQARFRFTPHCTLSFYPMLTPARERELLAVRVPAPAIIERLQVYLTRDPQPSKLLFEIALTGAAPTPVVVSPTGSGFRGVASGTSTSRA